MLREGSRGVGVMIVPATFTVNRSGGYAGIDAKGWGWSASRYSSEIMHDLKHDYELVPNPDVIEVHVDSRMMGVGGYDSWTPNVAKQYLVETGKTLTTDVVLVPVTAQDTSRSLYLSHYCLKV